MKSVVRMIDNALRFVPTEAELARKLGVDQQRLWNWKQGKRAMPDEKIVALALLGGTDPRAEIGAYRWEWIEKKRAGALAGTVGAACFLAALLSAGSGTANAGPADAPSRSLAAHYANYRRLRATLRSKLTKLQQIANPPPQKALQTGRIATRFVRQTGTPSPYVGLSIRPVATA